LSETSQAMLNCTPFCSNSSLLNPLVPAHTSSPSMLPGNTHSFRRAAESGDVTLNPSMDAAAFWKPSKSP
jgi:hypothetical protein